MEVLFMDGFDHYENTDLETKYDNLSVDGSNFAIVTNPKRSGRAALRLGSNVNWDVTKFLGVDAPNVTVGVAFYCNSYYDHGGFQLSNAEGVVSSVALMDDGSIAFYRGDCDGGGTILGQSDSGEWSLDTWHYLEFYTHTHQSSGNFKVRLDENFLFSGESVDTCATTSTAVTAFRLGGKSTNYGYVDDLYVLSGEEFLGDMEVTALYPTAAGNYTQWTPSGEVDNYACVNSQIYYQGSGEYVVCSGENLIDTYTFGDLTEYTVDNIQAVQIVAMTNKDGAGTESIKLVTRVNSNDYSGEDQFLPGGSKYRITVFTNNPDDSSQWEFEDVNSAEFGVKRTTA